MKILIINPYGIGDVLFTTPVVSNLRAAYPKAEISYLANARCAEFLKANPVISKVFTYERDAYVGNYAKYFELFSAIKRESFDMVLDFSLNSSFGFLGFACGIPQRIGLDYRQRGFFLTHRIPLSGFEGRHVVEYYLDCLRLLNIPTETKAMTLEVPAADRQWAREWLNKHAINPAVKPLIAVLPGGGASWGKAAKNKRWNSGGFSQLVDKIIENFDADIILLGDSKEEELCRDISRQTHFPVHFAVGQTTILQLAALFKSCRLAIVNDGGPLHVAAAAGLKTVSIFGPVDPLVYGPYPPENHAVVQKKLPCQPCYRRFRMANCSHINCLATLSVEEVYRKVQSVL